MEHFKEYFQVFEIFDADAINKIDVELELEYAGRYHYKFKLAEIPGGEEDDYDIQFTKCRITVGGYYGQVITDNAYDIMFYGPNSVSPTNKYVFAQVYSHLLAGFKKFIEEIKPEGFHFYGATGGMDLTYDRFVKKFLSDNGNKPDYMVFYKIEEKDYINKKLFNSQTPEMQETIKKAMQKWADQEEDFLKEKREEKISIRKKFMKAMKTVGHIIFDDDYGYIGLVYKVTQNGIEAIVARQRNLANITAGSKPIGTLLYDKQYSLTDDYDKKYYPPTEILSIPYQDRVLAFLDQLFDQKNYEENKAFIEKIYQNVPGDVIHLISNLYYKVKDAKNKLPKGRRLPEPLRKPPVEIPTRQRISPPSIPRRRPILQTWRRYNPEQLRTGEFEDE